MVQYRILSALCLLAAAPAAMGALDLRSNFDQRLLSAHNAERGEVGVQPMRWDPALAADAKDWANHLAATGRFEHSPDDPATEQQGENLWAGTPGSFSPESMVQLWRAEKRNFRSGIFPYNSASGRVSDVSHYTQLVWSRSRRVGCALTTGKVEDILVCRYSDAGNIVGETPI